MDKNLAWKIILILGLVAISAWILYPPEKTLKPGLDLAGGTSLIYEIDTQGLTEYEKKDLSSNMITILRRRIDPANIQNLVWRPQGSSRFEIQMPMASKEAHDKRFRFEKTVNDLLADNISTAVIMRILQKPAEQRTDEFNKLVGNSPDKLAILNDMAKIHDERKALQAERDSLLAKLKTPEGIMTMAGLNPDQIKTNNIGEWIKLDEAALKAALLKFLGSDSNLDLMTRYVKMYADWAKVADQLANPNTGKNIEYQKARKNLDKLNLTREQTEAALEMPPKSARKTEAIEQLKGLFPDRAKRIDDAVQAYDDYRPFRGSLDDPKDLQRMLKGAGILEFRILPIVGQANVDADKMSDYVQTLKEKGPKHASDKDYLWSEIENIKEWKNPQSVTAQFGDKFYVLTSNKAEETMLHNSDKKGWRLKKASPSQDEMGRRAIAFQLDERGGNLFGKITGNNRGRPLCILLDGVAISAPNINDRITTSGIITGSFTQTEVLDMVNKLNAGSLPARLIEQPLSVRTIGPSIGADNRNQGIKSGIIGLAGVILCMAIYYTVGGMIADVALMLNLLFTLAIMATLNATFTLAGIAGTILTIGMSVDANVLIFERIREEQLKGASLRMAIKSGYEKAFSAIFDSNLTTIMTALILYIVASDDIKGFAIVLMIGLASSMFTALFVTRTIFDFLLSKRLIKDHLVMMHLIKVPNINWMGLRPIFLTFSAIITIGGLVVFFTRDDEKNSKYDIEFTGGTSAQINLKENQILSRQQVEDKIRNVGQRLNNPALASANVYSIGSTGRQYEINTTETNKTITTVDFKQAGLQTVETAKSAIVKAEEKFDGKLNNSLVTQDTASSFRITSSQMNKSLISDILKTAFPEAEISEPQVYEVVNNAIMTAFTDQLEIQQNLQPSITSAEKVTEKMIDSYPELSEFIGGVKIACKVETAVTAEEIDRRTKDLRFKPDMRNLASYPYRILGPEMNALDAGQAVKSFVYISADPEASFRQLSDEEWSQFSDNAKTKVLAATQLETSLPRVTQISPSVGQEAKTKALIAIILSLAALLIYIWVRFGNMRYGLGTVVTLAHDTCVTVGAVAGCTYLAHTAIGEKLLIGDFKIDMVMVGAFLTLLGYSLNDSIVVYDRIRENCHKRPISPQLINDSINQTLSRTLLTGCTTLLVLAVMYIFGGKGLRGFNFAMLFGIILGTYSSIAISAPILLFGGRSKEGSSRRQ